MRPALTPSTEEEEEDKGKNEVESSNKSLEQAADSDKACSQLIV